MATRRRKLVWILGSLLIVLVTVLVVDDLLLVRRDVADAKKRTRRSRSAAGRREVPAVLAEHVRAILYSVGEDREDGGGSKQSPRSARTDRDEPTFTIEPPEFVSYGDDTRADR